MSVTNETEGYASKSLCAIRQCLCENTDLWEKVKSGKASPEEERRLLGSLVFAVMAATKGAIGPNFVQNIIKAELCIDSPVLGGVIG